MIDLCIVDVCIITVNKQSQHKVHINAVSTEIATHVQTLEA